MLNAFLIRPRVNFPKPEAILPLHLAEALHGSGEENVVANFQLLRLGNIFMECIILPMWASI